MTILRRLTKCAIERWLCPCNAAHTSRTSMLSSLFARPHFSRSSCFACVCVRSERGRALVERVECERLYVQFLQKYSSKYFSQSLTFDTSKRILKNGTRCARAFIQTWELEFFVLYFVYFFRFFFWFFLFLSSFRSWWKTEKVFVQLNFLRFCDIVHGVESWTKIRQSRANTQAHKPNGLIDDQAKYCVTLNWKIVPLPSDRFVTTIYLQMLNL